MNAAPPVLLAVLLATGSIAGGADRYAPFADPTFPFFGLSVDASPADEPRSNWVPRGVVVRLAEDIWALYDVDLVRLAALWRGTFPEGVTIAQFSYQNTKKKADGGQLKVPRFRGEILLANPMLPGIWTGKAAPSADPRDKGPDERELGRGPVDFEKYARWRGVETGGRWPTIVYEVAGGTVREVIVAEGGGVQRGFTSSGLRAPVSIALGNGENVVVPAGDASTTMQVVARRDPDSAVGDLRAVNAAPPRWPQGLATAGALSADFADARQIDHIPLPVANPWRRPVRPTAIAFFDDGRAAITTVDGDVWLASGLDKTLGNVRWRRFACGLHEPYSVAIRDGEIFVFDRGGLKRLHDRDGDGEADYHEWFCHDFWQSAETRDFPHDMALRADGGFYLVKGGQQNDHPSKHSGRVLSVSPDGQVEIYSSGHRNAFLGLRRETGELFACDQQGHWVPATPVQRLRKGGYYGFQPAAPPGVPEPEIAPPIIWLPHRAAQSAVDVVPMPDGTLTCVDYYRPGLLRIYPDAGAAGRGAAIPMDVAWDFPLLKGALNPKDGHLYLVGFQIWGTAAKQDAGFGRLRTDPAKRDHLPRAVRFGEQGVVLEFGFEIDPGTAADLGRYHAQSWNYQRSSGYGSGHFRADGAAGQDPLAIVGAHLSRDLRRVFLHLPGLKAADQLQVGYHLLEAGGEAFANTAYLTPRELGSLDLNELGFDAIDLAGDAASAQTLVSAGAEATPSADRGAQISLTYGCIACHSTDGSTEGKSGPTWKGLFGARREFLKGPAIAAADVPYLHEAILDPAARVLKGYDPKDVGMPSYRGILGDGDVASLVLFIRSLSE